MPTYTQYDTTFGNFVFSRPVYVHCIEVEFHRRDPFVIFDLSSYLVGYRVRPRVQRKIQVHAELSRKSLGLDEFLVHIPHKTVSYPMRLCLEFDTNWHE